MKSLEGEGRRKTPKTGPQVSLDGHFIWARRAVFRGVLAAVVLQSGKRKYGNGPQTAGSMLTESQLRQDKT